ncbi:MAG TPA: sigma-70 family RNA polymerase sigma factor [Pseudonocardiaceae bacterium]|nr:sigma-70 family RNA polymerase sigma factor [Pseudonocardiaceae bacterium]
MDTEALLAAATAGDQTAWNALVDRYTSLIWSIARGFRLSSTDAADVVQMTWLRLVEKFDRIVEPERLAGWLSTTARRECLQLIRRAGRTREVLGVEHDVDVTDPAPPVDDRLLRDERDAALWRVFAGLGERCQRLLRILMATPPPGYGEVADAVDMPIGSIGPTRQRCLNQLRDLMLAEQGQS